MDDSDEMNIDRGKMLQQKKNNPNDTKEEIALLKETKPKKKRKDSQPKKPSKEKSTKLESHVLAQNFVNQMRDVVLLDNQCNKDGKPATNKLSCLDNLYKTCVNKKIQSFLIQNGILSVIKMWMEPLPDNSMPNIHIRQTLLQLLLNMKITTQDLKNSQIGKIINFYSLNPNESSEVKKVAKYLMQKWSKRILIDEKNENY